jgi:hypothetical protein
MPQIFLFTGYDADLGHNVVGHRPATLEAIKRFSATPLGESLDDLDEDFLDENGLLADPLLDHLNPLDHFHRLKVQQVLSVYRHAVSRMSRERDSIAEGRSGCANTYVEMITNAQRQFFDRTGEFEHWLKSG